MLSPTHTLVFSETDTHTPINSNTEHAVAFFCHTHCLVLRYLSAHIEAPKPSKGTLSVFPSHETFSFSHNFPHFTPLLTLNMSFFCRAHFCQRKGWLWALSFGSVIKMLRFHNLLKCYYSVLPIDTSLTPKSYITQSYCAVNTPIEC